MVNSGWANFINIYLHLWVQPVCSVPPKTLLNLFLFHTSKYTRGASPLLWTQVLCVFYFQSFVEDSESTVSCLTITHIKVILWLITNVNVSGTLCSFMGTQASKFFFFLLLSLSWWFQLETVGCAIKQFLLLSVYVSKYLASPPAKDQWKRRGFEMVS